MAIRAQEGRLLSLSAMQQGVIAGVFGHHSGHYAVKGHICKAFLRDEPLCI